MPGEHAISAAVSWTVVEGVPIQAFLPPKPAILRGEARVRPGSVDLSTWPLVTMTKVTSNGEDCRYLMTGEHAVSAAMSSTVVSVASHFTSLLVHEGTQRRLGADSSPDDGKRASCL